MARRLCVGLGSTAVVGRACVAIAGPYNTTDSRLPHSPLAFVAVVHAQGCGLRAFLMHTQRGTLRCFHSSVSDHLHWPMSGTIVYRLAGCVCFLVAFASLLPSVACYNRCVCLPKALRQCWLLWWWYVDAAVLVAFATVVAVVMAAALPL
jgi:hypothetical protein